MTGIWQDLAALLLIAAAVLYLLRRLRRTGSGQRSCGCDVCPNCPAGESPAPLVSIEPTKNQQW